MPRIKIMRLIARLNVGGPARHVLWLTSRSTSPSVLASGRVESNEAEMTEMIRHEKVDVMYVAGLGRSLGLKDLAVFFRLLALMRNERPDIVDTHTAKAGMLGRLAAKCLGIKTVHTFHGHVLHGYFSWPMTMLFRMIEKFLGRFASDRIIVISQQQLDELADRYRVAPREKFRLVKLGIDLDRFAPRTAFSRDGIRIGLVGRLTAIKDPMMFLEAAHLVLEREPHARFIVIGDGELREELQAAAPSRTEFLGNRDDIEALMPTLDILAISSQNEGTPMSVIEAFAAGVVVAGTKAGGVVDLLADGRGLLSEIGDARALAENILRYIRDPALADATRDRALEYARKEYALERMIRETEEIYREVVA